MVNTRRAPFEWPRSGCIVTFSESDSPPSLPGLPNNVLSPPPIHPSPATPSDSELHQCGYNMATSINSLSSLLGRVSLNDHEEVLKLAKSKSDLAAQHIKAVALLKLDRYEDAVRVFEEVGTALKEKAWFEYGYALYRSGKPEQAVRVASEHDQGRGMTHLLAQAVCSTSGNCHDYRLINITVIPDRELRASRRHIPKTLTAPRRPGRRIRFTHQFRGHRRAVGVGWTGSSGTKEKASKRRSRGL